VSNSFPGRLNLLFDTVYPPGRKPHSSAEVVAALRQEGINISAPYLSQLRSGKRTHPSPATIAALARFFRIKVAYFTDDAYYAQLAEELMTLAHLRDEGVRRIAACTLGLSPTAQQDVLAHADELHRQHLLHRPS
jgi:transcriptional regulator with XRE-family HTH domain